MQFNALCPIHADSQRPAKAWLTKTFLVMQLTGIILLAGVLHVSASGVSQTITYTGKSVPLTKVFSIIEKQTGFVFFYDKKELQTSDPVTVKFQKVPLNEALQQLFAGHSLEYEIQGNTIFITKKTLTADLSPRQSSSAKDSGPVKGRVVNEKGEPVEGVSVTVKGSNVGTSTNANGEFYFNDVDDNATLVFTHTSIEKIEQKRNGREELTIGVKVKSSILDEIQVIPYGTQTRRFSVSNVATVKAVDIEKQPVNNPLLALQGRVPGMTVELSNGLPGAGVTVRVQGQNSLRNGNDPLFVIDGVPYPSQLIRSIWPHILGSSGNSFSVGSPFSFINPSDIESIDILKDADATAIYGSMAANGAILITTKKGKAGPVRVNINIQKGWGNIPRKIDLLNTPQYLEMRHEAQRNDGIATPSLTDYDINGLWDTTRYTDWQDELIGGTAQYNDAQISFSGGNAGISYLFGTNFHKETTVIPGTHSDTKGTVHFNMNSVSSNQRLQIQVVGNYMADNNRIPPTDLTSSALLLPPNAPALFNSDGTLNWEPDINGVSTWLNPLADVLYNKFNIKTTNLVSNASISYQLFPGLQIKSSFGFNDMSTEETILFPSKSQPPQDRPFFPRVSSFANGNISTWIIEPQVSYANIIGKGKINALAGGTIRQTNTNQRSVVGIGFNSDEVIEDITAASTLINDMPGVASVYKYNSIYGRAGYNWNDKYLINFTGRVDGSSRFGETNQFHFFGSVGGAWIFSEEKLIRQNLSFLSFGKIRASFGTTGNDQIGDYRTLNRYSPINSDIPYQGATGLQVNELPNPYLQWEETKKLQFGLELGIFRDKILLNTTYFRNQSSNQLLPFALPFITGFGDITRNFPALVENRGWEFSLTTTNITNVNFKWTSSFNITVSKNELISYPNIETSPFAQTFVVGESINIFKKFHFIGVDSETGKYLFSDKDGKPTSDPIVGVDDVFSADNLPKFYGGLQNSFQYKGFEIDVLLQFAKQKGLNYFFGNQPGVYYANQPVTVLNRWRQPKDETSIQKFSSDGSLTQSWTNASAYSDGGISDASFVRLKSFSLSWQIPDRWKNKLHFHQGRLFAHAQNVYTLTDYIGMDPENKSVRSLPPLRVITFGIQVTL